MTLSRVLLMMMRHTNNFHIVSQESDIFSIEDGVVFPSGRHFAGMWIAITGSVLNNNVYRIKAVENDAYVLEDGSTDDVPTQNEPPFEGVIFGLAIPSDFMQLAEEVKAYLESPEGKPSAKTSETVINLHSWTKGAGRDGTLLTWSDVFADKLEPFMQKHIMRTSPRINI